MVAAKGCSYIETDLGGVDCAKSGKSGIDTGVCDEYNTQDGTKAAEVQRPSGTGEPREGVSRSSLSRTPSTVL